MKKAKTSAVFMLSVLALGALAGCANDTAAEEKYTVDFKVLNEANVWTTFKTKDVVGGKVEVPEAPAKLYYDFGGWYNEEALSTKFVATGITANASAYAKYIAQEVTIHIDNDEPVTKKLEDVANATMEPKEGLEFNGWYKDAALTVEWNKTDAVTDLYAANMAMLTFNNGYEDVYTAMVKYGSKFANPAEQNVTVEGATTTLEKKEIKKDYMDEDDIHYVDAEGKAFDFTKDITKNETITVNFNTVGLKSQVKFDEAKDQWILMPKLSNQWAKAPVLSMQNTYTVNVANEAGEEVPTEVEVKAIDVQGDGIITSEVTKIIIGEGIMSIGGLNVAGPSKVTDVVLPSTLKVIDNCFNNFNELKSFKLNEGVEVIIASLFKNPFLDDGYKYFDYGSNHDFEIEIPASVKNLAMVPTNLKFAEGSKFAKEDGRIILNDGDEKILISDLDHINDSTIVVPEGFTKIQAGTYLHGFDYLMLPSTFKNVNYNGSITDYPYYSRDTANPCSFHLFDAATLGKETQMDRTAFAISPMLGGRFVANPSSLEAMFTEGLGIVKFNSNAIPTEMDATAFTGDGKGTGWLNGSWQDSNDEKLHKSLVVNDNVDKIYVTLRLPIAAEDAMLGEQCHSFSTIMDTKKINNIDELIEAIKSDANNSEKVDEIDALMAGKEFVIYSAGKVIAADAISGEAFLTLAVKEAK